MVLIQAKNNKPRQDRYHEKKPRVHTFKDTFFMIAHLRGCVEILQIEQKLGRGEPEGVGQACLLALPFL